MGLGRSGCAVLMAIFTMSKIFLPASKTVTRLVAMVTHTFLGYYMLNQYSPAG